MVVDIEPPAEHELPAVVHALNTGGLGLRFGQRRQEHAGQNGDDGDDHQQFDEGESAMGFRKRGRSEGHRKGTIGVYQRQSYQKVKEAWTPGQSRFGDTEGF